MKKYILLLYIVALCFSCTHETETEKETPFSSELGTVYKDSFPKPEIVNFKLGPKVPKEKFINFKKPYSLDPDYGKEVVYSITPKDGLPPVSYYESLQDKSGNIWIDKENNLMKYDGTNFKEFELYNSNFNISEILIDQDNHLWIHKYTFGDTSVTKIEVFDGIRFKVIDGLEVYSEDPENIVGVSMFKGLNNSIWVRNTKDQKLLKYEGQNIVESYDINDLSLYDFNAFFIDQLQDLGDEGLFFLNRDDNLIILKDGQFKTINLKTILNNTRVFDFYAIDSNSFYVTTPSGIYFIKNQKPTLITKESGRIAIVDSEGFVWSNLENVTKFKDSTKLNFDKSYFNDARFTRLNTDDNDNIWVLGQNFIGKFDSSIKTYNGLLQDDRIRTISQTKNGDFYLGTFNNGFLHYDGSFLTNYKFTEKERFNNNISSFAEDPNGHIWFTNLNKKLTKFDGKYFQSYTLPGFYSEIKYVDSKGGIWFINGDNSKNTSILYKFDGRSFYKITSVKELGSNITSVYGDKSGNIWIGCSEGLWKNDKGIFTKYTTKDGLPNNFINTVNGNHAGNLWLGTDQGLSVFDGYSFTNYGRTEGISENFIGSIIPDTINNKIWLKGQLSNNLTAVSLDSETMQLQVENYSATEGFPIPSFSELLLDQQGALWLGMSDGDLARFDYKTLKKNRKAFPIHFYNITLNGESMVWSELNDNYAEDSLIAKTEMIYRFGNEKTKAELVALKENFASVRYDSLMPFDFIPVGLRLPYSANSLSFEFYAIDPFLAKNTRYQYYLEGFDNAWSPLSKSTFANYGNLTEGNYTLKIKALNSYGLWSETSYSFTIMPPWYRTWWAYVIYGLIALFLFWQLHNYQKKRTIKREREKAQERELKQAKEIEKAYNELKATQEQLIQSEKMASLGELTAGIAHEIQNPLNFVNNFSEVSIELMDEMTEELDNDDLDEAKAIASDIKQNLEKITHHGKRADSIVKGMLQHSRNNSGEKELVDLNKLTDEYMRLAYHGLRAKNKSFNATLETHFDETIGKLEIVPQDIGRVILNLFTNAFYAVEEKQQTSKKAKVSDYKPTVSVVTKKDKHSVSIKVKDNGDGIPESALKKIFDPFFTTKPAGKGTGLGLSMSYDIIKNHGGNLKFNTKQDEFTEFEISLPIKTNKK